LFICKQRLSIYLHIPALFFRKEYSTTMSYNVL
jgi:hypothetical protein